MIVFLDSNNKIYYVMAPKCGTNTISKMLNVDLDASCDLSNINNPEYKKVIIIRKNLVRRFLSGFYEDLFNNSCYSNINIKFNDYLLFLYDCYQKKHPYVNNMKIYNTQDIPIWFGNCSGYSLPITDDKGNFTSHIQSQYFAINYIVRLIENKTNVVVVELNKLSTYLNNILMENVKQTIYFDGNFSETTLSYIKNQRIIVNDDNLTDNQKKLILEIYEEDEIFINNLENNFCVF
jgi:hypothetical protein